MAVSWAMGGVVVVLSLIVGQVEGNLLEVLHKTVNLLVAPLFVLFFMAMYVQRASSVVAYSAVVVSIVAAIAVAFFSIGGLGVLWIMPISLISGIAWGTLGSLFVPLSHVRQQSIASRITES